MPITKTHFAIAPKLGAPTAFGTKMLFRKLSYRAELYFGAAQAVVVFAGACVMRDFISFFLPFLVIASVVFYAFLINPDALREFGQWLPF